MNSISENVGADKIERVLGIYTKLISGSIVNKSEEAINYNVNERSIQRDIDDIRNFFDQSIADSGLVNSVIYDRQEKGYRLEQIYQLKFSNSEILAICKILLDSRAFTKKEMQGMLEKLIDCCVPVTNQQLVKELIRNEEFHYIEPRHKTVFIDKLWTIGQAIHNQQYIEIEYGRLKDNTTVKRKVQPAAIMFSEYYFYLVGFIDETSTESGFDVIHDSFPTIYRVDRIQKLDVLDEKYSVPYTDRFQEGEFRKRIQFMYGGKLRKIKFRYSGVSIEAVLDRLPTATVISKDEKGYVISAEVFGDGVDMWIRSQGNTIEML